MIGGRAAALPFRVTHRDSSLNEPGSVGHRYGSNVPAFADKIDDGPMFLALLQMGELQTGQFTAPESSAEPAVMARAFPSSTGPAS